MNKLKWTENLGNHSYFYKKQNKTKIKRKIKHLNPSNLLGFAQLSSILYNILISPDFKVSVLSLLSEEEIWKEMSL